MGGGDALCDDKVLRNNADPYDADDDVIADIVGGGSPSLVRGGDFVSGGPDLRLFGHSFMGESGDAADGSDSDASSGSFCDDRAGLEYNKDGDHSLMFGRHPHANAGGAGPYKSDDSSTDDFEDTDSLIDNISDLLKTCFRKNMAGGRHIAGGRHAHKRRRTERSSKSPDCKKATNRSNLSWLSDIIKKIPADKKCVIEGYGFSCCLYVDCSVVPRYFAQWIADHVQVESTDIILDSGCIHLSVQSFSEVTGLPNSGSIVRGDCDGAKEAFISYLGLSEFPTIKMLGELLLKDVLSDDQYFVCFMAVYLSSFLCPNSSTFPSTKYLLSILVPDHVRNYNWALFGFNWYIMSVKKYLRDRPKLMSSKSNLTLGGCNYYPAVYYLDLVDLGTRSPVGCFPRIKVWKGEMIKDFSLLDLKDGHEYGRRKLKDLSNTCYVLRPNDGRSTSGPCSFTVSLQTLFKDSLSTIVLKDICDMFDQFASSTDHLVSSRAGDLVISVLSRVKVASESLDESQFSDSNADNHVDGSDLGVPADNPHPTRPDQEVIADNIIGKARNSESTLVVDDPDAIPDLNDAPNSDAPTVVVNSDIAHGSVSQIQKDEVSQRCSDDTTNSPSNCGSTMKHTADAHKEVSVLCAGIADAIPIPGTSKVDVVVAPTPCLNTSTSVSTQPLRKVERIKYHRNLRLPDAPIRNVDKSKLSFPFEFAPSTLDDWFFESQEQGPSERAVQNVNEADTQPYNIRRVENRMDGSQSEL